MWADLHPHKLTVTFAVFLERDIQHSSLSVHQGLTVKAVVKAVVKANSQNSRNSHDSQNSNALLDSHNPHSSSTVLGYGRELMGRASPVLM
ncbi:unnamed protein product, partial [Didymodactylos carnosus]